MDKEQLTQEYQGIVHQHLDKLTDRLVEELTVISHAKHDLDTYLLDFRVQMQNFTRGFPDFTRGFLVYWFPMDRELTQLESDLSLGLLSDLEITVPEEAVDSVIYEEADVQIWELGYDALVSWFGECWRKAGDCAYPAYIAPHDSSYSINLSTMQEVSDDQKWPSDPDPLEI